MPPLIELRGINKDYGAHRALHEVTLSIGGGVTGLLGPNGSGKSTLIKVVLGLVAVSSGEGTVMGHDLRRSRAIRAEVGYMPEDDCYIAGLTGVETVAFAARLSGLPRLEALRRAHEILDFCGTGQERYRLVETYSIGMRQKLKFAQSIVHDPPLLILDEPTTGLDPEERRAMLQRVRILAERHGKGVLLSTHILPDVKSVCDHVVILAQGTVRVADSLEALSRPASPAYHVRVLGKPQGLLDRIAAAGMGAELGEDGVLTLAAADRETLGRLWGFAAELGIGLRSLAPARNSLEQIFLDAVSSAADRAAAQESGVPGVTGDIHADP